MPQRFYFDEKDLDGTVNKLDRNLMEMLDFAYLHEDMVNTIEQLMSDWGLISIDSGMKIEPLAPMRQIKIIPFKEKDAWELCPKYNIGNK